MGIGKNSKVKRAIIDKNARIGENVQVRLHSVIYWTKWTYLWHRQSGRF